MVKLVVGEKVPDFSLPNQEGKSFTFSSLLGKKIVLYFYPKDFSTGCTKEACHFRDQYEDFIEAGAVVIGVSGDSIESHKKFIDKYLLPFTLLSDSTGEVRKLYGISGFILPSRITFVIDKEGIIQHIFTSQTNMKAYIDEALEALRKIK
jgi:peroxiredoxin Q/BCP